MPDFDVCLGFALWGHTTGLKIEAKNREAAEVLTQSCIDADGNFDSKRFVELGGDNSRCGWDTEAGTDHGYEISSVEEVVP